MMSGKNAMKIGLISDKYSTKNCSNTNGIFIVIKIIRTIDYAIRILLIIDSKGESCIEMDELNKTILDNFRKKMDESRLTDKQLSLRMGRSEGYVNRIFNRGTASMENIYDFAKYFSVSEADFLKRDSIKSDIRVQIDLELDKFPKERLTYILDVLKNTKKD